MTEGGGIGVLIVDDSAVVRQLLTARLAASPGIEVVGAVADPIFAMAHMNRVWPDVVVLELEMPRMDGLTFLRRIMAVRPTPVIVCSALTARGAETAMEALAAGAVTVIPRPPTGLKEFVETQAADIVAAVRSAAVAGRRVHVPVPSGGVDFDPVAPAGAPPARHTTAPAAFAPAHHAPGRSTAMPASSGTAPPIAPRAPTPVRGARTGSTAHAGADHLTSAKSSLPDLSGNKMNKAVVSAERVVAIGTSTGGTRALEVVLPALPRSTPGVVIVQHMPERFTAAFAQRLDTMCRMRVREAADGDEVLPGHVLVAPGGRHMELVRMGGGYRVRVFDAPPVNRHRPSVDVLFRSVAKAAGNAALGVIMTGMGDDGARGLLEMHRAGAFTVAQDEATCVVHGMPHEAVQLGAVDREAPLESIAEVIHRYG
ncbi:protein-glutamate methylesterase/protein-glutamine glutaminase [Catenuloplanes atrovinosus]|uniref:Protein-glutamate methylesterase/protein-glutamine glutaminase n=1 Tax=Catenuloplanes atrovinosus TaxID=137266 RepID=A0AAE4C8T1_9ACTN|nr:chemotaxis response regulator protein-glutamate methylesterase [Catenuloplanes atrovinosus]MDR7275846.1 two-component system chemotaxis response regulator CheB [Catenuloplanes atrovinosus]